MGLRQTIANYLLKEYKLGGTRTGGLQFVELQAAPTWGYQSYLKAYGEIGWLYACVNTIAQSVAKTPWHLYTKAADGELTEITEHPIIDLLDNVNPFQSFYQFLYLGTMYKLLVGEEFWQINFAGQLPAEMWLAPPAFMSVIPDPNKYISHYEFRRSGMDKAVRFSIDEIIHIKTPNPYNEYRGLSPAQALTVELDTEKYASQYQQKLFRNDATPGFMLEYPAENLPSQDIRKELQIEWDDRFRGINNVRRTAFLWGAKASTLTMTNRDMDYENLRKFGRDAILGAYHMPRSILGITEDVNRANAEAANYTYAMYCVQPELTELRESLNRELTVFYGDDLYLDFENPVPEDKLANNTNSVNLYKNGIAKLNEARAMVGLDPIDDAEGEEFYKQPAPVIQGQQGNGEIPPEKGYRILEISHPKGLPDTGDIPPKRALPVDEKDREAYWKAYVGRAESYEARTISNLREMWLKQETEALARLDKATTGKEPLIDLKTAKKQYSEAVTDPMTDALAVAIKAGKELIDPENPHKDSPIPQVIPPASLKWLKTRIAWAADEIGEESAARLSKILLDGFTAGDSIDTIRQAIQAEFNYFSKVRAERIARTEIIMASSHGTLEGYAETGIVKKVEFYTAIDERVCEDCFSFHQEVFSLDDAMPMIPLHPQCRCGWLPVIE